jgi:hypothetical protein
MPSARHYPSCYTTATACEPFEAFCIHLATCCRETRFCSTPAFATGSLVAHPPQTGVRGQTKFWMMNEVW